MNGCGDGGVRVREKRKGREGIRRKEKGRGHGGTMPHTTPHKVIVLLDHHIRKRMAESRPRRRVRLRDVRVVVGSLPLRIMGMDIRMNMRLRRPVHCRESFRGRRLCEMWSLELGLGREGR